MKYLFEQYGDFLLSVRGHTVLNRRHIVAIKLKGDRKTEDGHRVDKYLVLDSQGTGYDVESKQVETGTQAKWHLRNNLWELCTEDVAQEDDNDE